MTQNHSNRHVLGSIALSVGLALALGACSTSQHHAPLKPETTTFRNEVVPMTAQTQVRFLPGDYGVIAPDEGARLEAFLNANSVAPSARVTLSTPGSVAPALAVRDRLVAHGVYPRNILIQSARSDGRTTLQVVDVSVEQDQVRPPQCGSWNPNDYFESTTSDYGCSTVRALGLMVADPHDLVAGKAAGHTSGTAQANAIDRYHNDKQMPLQSDTFKPN